MQEGGGWFHLLSTFQEFDSFWLVFSLAVPLAQEVAVGLLPLARVELGMVRGGRF